MTSRALISSVIVALLVSTPINGQLSCYTQSCMNCADTTVVGTTATCTAANAVHNNAFAGVSTFNTLTTTADTTFACLKYIARPSSGLPHVLRGCIYINQVDSLITTYNDYHALAGITNIDSSICYGNNCNSAIANGPILSLLLIGLIAKLLL